MSEQLSILANEDVDKLIVRVKAEHNPIATFCLFSGGNDSTVVAHRCRDAYDTLAFIDTTTAIPGVREFVRDFAAWINKPLRVLEHDNDAYRGLVLGEPKRDGSGRIPALGFPGPAQHGRAYNRLKERQLDRLVRETKIGHPRTSRILCLAGVRRGESMRRRGRASVTRRGATVFANPLIDWTNEQMRAYRLEHQLPESDVAALLHRSGECNCGAFAAPGERDDLKQLYPAWFETRIRSLERDAENAGVSACRWGDRPMDLVPDDVGDLCSDCQLRFDGVSA